MDRNFPEVGEVVLATVKEITPYGAYVTLDEYDDLIGFLHISEISTGWVKNIERHIRERQKVVLKVIRINISRNEIDLSLRQVSKEEKKRKLTEVKRGAKANTLLNMVKNELGLDSDEEYRNKLEEAFNSLYDALEEVVRKGPDILKELGIDDVYADKLYSIAKERIRLPEVEISGVLEITSPSPKGVEVIKEVLQDAMKVDVPDIKIRMIYLGSSRFKISVKAENYKIAERVLTLVIQKIERGIKRKGSFKFIREKAR
jgi:translation initiation factor 2 subunit 1